MLKLHGSPLSGFYNIAKHCLLEKGAPFEEVSTAPSQEPAFLAKSPMGKIPCLETAAGFLVETNVILDYIEDVHPTPPLYPADPWARAKTREIMRIVEHYVEAPAHRLAGHVIFKAPLPEAVREEVRPAAAKGLAALGRVAHFSPYITGANLTNADIFAYHSIVLARNMLQAVYGWDIVGEIKGMAAWFELMAGGRHAQAIATAQKAALAAMQK